MRRHKSVDWLKKRIGLKKSDDFMILRGRKEETSPDGLQLLKPEIYLPKFEYTASVSLEACVAQIAVDLGKSEDTG